MSDVNVQFHRGGSRPVDTRPIPLDDEKSDGIGTALAGDCRRGTEAPPLTGARRLSPPLTVVGVLLLAAGLACLGWVAYQYLGTNVVAEKRIPRASRSELRTNNGPKEKKADPKNKKKSETVTPASAIGAAADTGVR